MARTRRQKSKPITSTLTTSTETTSTEITSTETTSTETTSTTETNSTLNGINTVGTTKQKVRNSQICSNCHKLRNPSG